MRLALDTIEKNILTALRQKHGDTTVKVLSEKVGIEISYCIEYLKIMMDKQVVGSADGKGLFPLSRIYMTIEAYDNFHS